jgi:hypothetical protein
MQRLNLLTLAAFLLGVCAFVYDAAAPAPGRFVVEAPYQPKTVHMASTPTPTRLD